MRKGGRRFRLLEVVFSQRSLGRGFYLSGRGLKSYFLFFFQYQYFRNRKDLFFNFIFLGILFIKFGDIFMFIFVFVVFNFYIWVKFRVLIIVQDISRIKGVFGFFFRVYSLSWDCLDYSDYWIQEVCFNVRYIRVRLFWYIGIIKGEGWIQGQLGGIV